MAAVVVAVEMESESSATTCYSLASLIAAASSSQSPPEPSTGPPLPKSSSRTGRFDSKNQGSNLTEKEQYDEQDRKRTSGIEEENVLVVGVGLDNVGGSSSEVLADGKPFPDLPGLQPDLWEGPKWNVIGFLVQYLWAFGIVFALIASGIAVATYYEEATDFKETPAYKKSIQSRELLEQPDASNSDVFEYNPTEVAPSLV